MNTCRWAAALPLALSSLALCAGIANAAPEPPPYPYPTFGQVAPLWYMGENVNKTVTYEIFETNNPRHEASSEEHESCRGDQQVFVCVQRIQDNGVEMVVTTHYERAF